MTSLGDAYGGPDGWRRLARIGAGVGLGLAGAGVFATGLFEAAGDVGAALGLAEPLARRLGITLAMPVLPAALLWLRRHLPATAGRTPIAGGLLAVGAAIALVWITGQPGPGIGVAVLYGVGVALVLAGVLAGPVAADLSRGSAPARPRRTPAFVRDRGGARSGPLPADGGREEDEDLSFPLTEEER